MIDDLESMTNRSVSNLIPTCLYKFVEKPAEPLRRGLVWNEICLLQQFLAWRAKVFKSAETLSNQKSNPWETKPIKSLSLNTSKI